MGILAILMTSIVAFCIVIFKWIVVVAVMLFILLSYIAQEFGIWACLATLCALIILWIILRTNRNNTDKEEHKIK